MEKLVEHLVIVPETEAQDAMARMLDNRHGQSRDSLDQLIQRAERMSAASIRGLGKMSTTLFIHGLDGIDFCMARNVQEETVNDDFMLRARLKCIAHAADATLLVAEAWMRLTKKDQKLDLNLRPSEAPDRQEVLVLIGESREQTIHKALPINRSINGEFLRFGEALEIPAEIFEGRFGKFLTNEIPDEKTRNQAKQLIEEAETSLENMQRKKRGQGHGRMMV
jgi:hypothetical protein